MTTETSRQPSEQDVTRAAVLKRVEAVIASVWELARYSHVAQQEDFAKRLIATGYPTSLPGLDQLALDLVEWRDRLQVETPKAPQLCRFCAQLANSKDPWGGADVCDKHAREVWLGFFRHVGTRVQGAKYTLDGEPCDLVEFVRDNEDLTGEDLTRIHQLRTGSAIQFGGGAAARFTFARVR